MNVPTVVGSEDELEETPKIPGTHAHFFRSALSLGGYPVGDWAEFGTASGRSAREMLSVMPAGSILWMFDSWKGLPEDGPEGSPWRQGDFLCDIPWRLSRDSRTRFVPGLFSEMVGPWAEARAGQSLALAHIDCDLGSSATDVLDGIASLIGVGTVLVFDELLGYAGWEQGEWKAWGDFARDHDVSYRWICRSGEHQAALVVM